MILLTMVIILPESILDHKYTSAKLNSSQLKGIDQGQVSEPEKCASFVPYG
jgi:hypothetical protein